jgi:predicted xylose isomerase-like sugar epimerase
MVVSDVVLDAPLPEAVEKDVLAYVGCIAGAARREAYFDMLKTAGLGDVEVLRDVDSLEQWAAAAGAEARALAERTGVRLEDVAGTVRSVTYRARKPR